MHIKDYLQTSRKEIQRLYNAAREAHEKAEKWREIALSPAAVQLRHDKVAASIPKDKMAEAINKAVDAERQSDGAILRWREKQAEVEGVIRRHVPEGVLREVLVEYYAKGASYRVMAEKTGKSLGAVYGLHKKALKVAHKNSKKA